MEGDGPTRKDEVEKEKRPSVIVGQYVYHSPSPRGIYNGL